MLSCETFVGICAGRKNAIKRNVLERESAILIGVDGRAANTKTRVGVNVYCYEIIRALARAADDVRLRVYLDQEPLDDFPVTAADAEIRVLPLMRRWTLRQLSRELRRDPPDVFLAPTPQYPFFSPCPKVAVAHETAFMYLPECWGRWQRFQTATMLRLACRRAAHMIAITEVVKEDLIRWFHITPDRVTVAHHGVSPQSHPCADTEMIRRVREKFALPERFALFIGRLSPRKNVSRQIQAFETLRRRHPELPHHFVIAGDKGWLYEDIFAQAAQSPEKDRIHFLGLVHREDIPPLLAQADVLMVPALWEAFGLPVLEGMASGVAVLTSDRSGLAEVAGDGAVRVNPYDVDAIADGLGRLIMDDAFRVDTVARGLKRARDFTWEKTAQITLEVLRRAAQSKQRVMTNNK